MGKINVGRLILGGVVAGIVNDILGFGVDGWLLNERWTDAMKNLGKGPLTSSEIVLYNVIGFATGFLVLWVYVAIRPRFGPGVKTAIYAGFVSWLLTALFPNAGFMYASGLFPRHLTLYTTMGAIVELCVSAIIGAWLYKEE